jgi:hypothetical protein
MGFQRVQLAASAWRAPMKAEALRQTACRGQRFYAHLPGVSKRLPRSSRLIQSAAAARRWASGCIAILQGILLIARRFDRGLGALWPKNTRTSISRTTSR